MRDERHRERVHDSGHDVQQDERRVGEDDQQGTDERADREREHEADPDERGDAEPAPADELPASAQGSERRGVLELHDLREKRPAHGEPDRDGAEEHGRGQHNPGADRDQQRAEQGAETGERQAVRVDRADLVPPVDLDEGLRRRGLHEPEAEQCERRPERDHEQHQRARPLARGVDAEQPEAAEDERLHERDHDPERDEDEADARRRARPAVRRTSAPHWTGSAPRRACAQGEAARRDARSCVVTSQTSSSEQDPDRDQRRRRVAEQGGQGLSSPSRPRCRRSPSRRCRRRPPVGTA